MRTRTGSTHRKCRLAEKSIIVGDTNPFNESSTARGAALIVTRSPHTSTVSGGSFFPLVLSITVLLKLSSGQLGYTRCGRQDDGGKTRGLLLEIVRVGGRFFSFSG
jgi:hypothetical protein